MRIVLTGGGSGGHFYPLIAVADQVLELAEQQRLLKPDIYYLADKPYDEKLLFRKGIKFRSISAGKLRRYFSIKNFFDIFKTAYGVVSTIFTLFRIYPDVVFTNGSYVSFPVLVAARILGIPIFLHISDAIPSRSLLAATKSAVKISIAFSEAVDYLPEKAKKNVALTGNPIRDEIIEPLRNGAHEFLELDYNIPTIFVMGGSQGAEIINDAVIDALPKLLYKYNVIHQVGRSNFSMSKGRADVVIHNHAFRERYKSFPFLDILALRMAAGAADLIISRAGGGSISEIASWATPSIMIPIPESVSRDQEKNAFAYAKFGACVVMKQQNLSANLIVSEVERLMDRKEIRDNMIAGAQEFAKKDAAIVIAAEILEIGQSHE